MTTLIKKISIKTIGAKPEREIIGEKENGKPILGFVSKDIAEIVGVATSTRTGATNYGDFIGLRGQFRAINTETGEIYQSSQCFLPDDVIDMICAQLAMDGVKSVDFAFKIGIIANDTEIGYEYVSMPLIDVQKNDPLENIMKRIEQKSDDEKAEKKVLEKAARAKKKKA